MTFDETIEKFEQEANEYNGLVPMETVYELILDLKEEYVPTIEMTKEEKKTLEYYLENSTFFSLIERKHAGINVEMIGITIGSNEFLDLSDEDLMQVWLHPETIKVINEEQV